MKGSLRFMQHTIANRGIGALVVLLSLFVLILIIGLALSFKRWEGQAPTARFDREFRSLGRKPALSLQVEDAGTGLNKVAVALKQKDQLVTLVDESYPRSEERRVGKG